MRSAVRSGRATLALAVGQTAEDQGQAAAAEAVRPGASENVSPSRTPSRHPPHSPRGDPPSTCGLRQGMENLHAEAARHPVSVASANFANTPLSLP